MELTQIDGNVARLVLRGGKANAMSPAFIDKLGELVEAADGMRPRVLIVTGYDRFFSGGLDLPTLIDLDRAALASFMGRFADVMLRLFELPFPVIAAMNGHAIAGGYVLAIQADYRIAADGGSRIGLIETQLGIGLPAVVVEPLRLQIPPTSLFPVAIEGKLFSVAEARALGLIDEIAPADALDARALEKARSLAELPPGGVAHVKASLRAPAAAKMRAENLVASWLDGWYSPEGQDIIRATVARLQKGS